MDYGNLQERINTKGGFPTVMLALGAYRFSISSAAYSSLVKQDSWGWTEQARAGREPILQLTSKPLTTVSLAGTIYPEYKLGGGFTQLPEMRAEADRGVPLTMLAFETAPRTWGSTGNGAINLGQWVILSLSETQRNFRANGSPRAIEFSIQLKRYVD